MSDTSDLAKRFLATLEARDWGAWSALLADDVVYEMPQTRERITDYWPEPYEPPSGREHLAERW